MTPDPLPAPLLAALERPKAIDILVAASAVFHMPVLALRGRSREYRFAIPRILAMAACRELTDLSYPKIGMSFGGRDHTTVLSACRRSEFMCRTDIRWLIRREALLSAVPAATKYRLEKHAAAMLGALSWPVSGPQSISTSTPPPRAQIKHSLP
jgi:Bacterial dnaA protein helix-turn-helix